MKQIAERVLGRLVAAAIALSVAAPVSATTLVRAGLEDLVAENDTIVVGEVVEAHSYWNEDHTFILTDVDVDVSDMLKGDPRERVVKVTLLGGTVDDLTTLILGGAELVPGSSYVMFLDREDLPGAREVRTVRDHVQGVFDLVQAGDDLRAVSQASRFPLLPDARGNAVAPGGKAGLPLAAMLQSIHELMDRPRDARQEVEP
jgi:hypothetical protein